jgi:hypothetical protein
MFLVIIENPGIIPMDDSKQYVAVTVILVKSGPDQK